MAKQPHAPKLSLAARMLRAYLRTGLRGETRLSFSLARKMKSLQQVPIEIGGLPPVYMDLRLGDAREWLKGSPWENSPREVDEQAVMRRVVKKGDVVYDIGANIGLHTVLLSRLVGAEGRVFAFEPNSELLTNLGRTVEALDNVTLYPYGLSNQSTQRELFIPLDHTMASLADWTKGRVEDDARKTVCELRRMDDLVESQTLLRPHFIKCDVEGAELMVFEGGANTLNRTDAPIILFEANVHTAQGFGLKVSEASDFLAKLPLPVYRFLEIQEGGVLKPFHHTGQIHSNILAVPLSRSAHFPELT